jgi:hypothetical protein
MELTVCKLAYRGDVIVAVTAPSDILLRTRVINGVLIERAEHPSTSSWVYPERHCKVIQPH